MLTISESNLSASLLKQVFDSVYVDCKLRDQGLIIFDDFRVAISFDHDRDRIKYFTTVTAPTGLSKEQGLEFAYKISKEYDILAEYSKGSLFITSTLILYGGMTSKILVKALRRFIYIAHNLVYENILGETIR